MSKLDELINKLCPNGVEFKKLSELMTPNPKSKIGAKKAEQMLKGEYPFYTSGKSVYYINEHMVDGENIFVNDGGQADIKYYDGKSSYADHVISFRPINVNGKYLYYVLMKKKEYINEKMFRGSGIKNINKNDFFNMLLPVPPLEVQCEIVRILDNFTLLSAELSAELSARQKQYEYYKNLLLEPKANYKNVKFMKLRDIGQVKMCKRILKSQTNSISGIPFYKIGTFGKEPDAYISEETYKEYINKYNYPKKGDILISCAGTIGRTIVYDGQPAYFQDSNIVWLEHNEKIVLNKYLMYCYSLEPWNISTGGTIARLYNDNILRAEIPVPPLEEQERIVNILDRFDKLCNDISEGLPAEIEARKKQYEYYRDKLLTFKELKSNER